MNEIIKAMEERRSIRKFQPTMPTKDDLAQIVLFSTGRGTPFACPVPTLKIATNTPLATKKHGWIDFNAGQLLTDGKTLPELSQALMEDVLATASGRLVCSERNGFHDLAIFKTGVTL